MTDLEFETKKLIDLHGEMVDILTAPITEISRQAYSNRVTQMGIQWSAVRRALDALSFKVKV